MNSEVIGPYPDGSKSALALACETIVAGSGVGRPATHAGISDFIASASRDGVCKNGSDAHFDIGCSEVSTAYA